MTTEHQLPAHLERIGCQLTAAAHDLYGPSARPHRRAWPPRAWGTIARLPRVAMAGASAGVAAAVAAILLFATAGAPPAYALTASGNGTYTLTINQAATAIPALNAKFKQLGINMTVIPVTTTCTAPNNGVPLVGGWPASTLNQTITLDQANIPAGSHGVIAVYQTPSGGVDLDVGSVDGSGPLPPCLNPNDVGYMK
ncbi:MAG: hypothetical protein ACRDNK_11465 [Solirubrobacteraceae bacterium]